MITCRILPRVLSNIHVITIQGGGIFFFWGEVWVVALGVRVSYHVPMMILMLMMMVMINVRIRVVTPGKRWRGTVNIFINILSQVSDIWCRNVCNVVSVQGLVTIQNRWSNVLFMTLLA